MGYSKKSGFLTHGNCANFRNGFCTLYGVAVDPSGAACPNFISRSPTLRPQIRHGVYPMLHYPAQLGYGLPLLYKIGSLASSQAGYNYPPSYTLPPPTMYGYRTGYSSGPVPSAPTAPKQIAAGSFSISTGRRGRGGGGGGRGSGSRGRGKMGGFAAGPGGSCVCPSCGYSARHVLGTPCYQQTCPKCGNRMTRGR